MIRLTHTSEIDMALRATGRVVLFFGASWCSQCKPLKRRIDHLPVVEVDADKFVELTTRYDVRGLPTVVEVKRESPLGPDQYYTWTGQALKPKVVEELFA